jgi:hypothetical protein
MRLSSDGREWLLPTLFDASLLTLKSRPKRLFFRLGRRRGDGQARFPGSPLRITSTRTSSVRRALRAENSGLVLTV